MSNEYYNKFINFLKSHDLYDDDIIESFNNYYVRTDYNDDYIGVPCVPCLTNDTSVVLNIYAYVNTLLLISDKRDSYRDNLYHRYMLPLFYEALYIRENQTMELLKYKEEQKKLLLADDTLNYDMLLENVELLINEYEKGTYDANQVMKRTKRLAKRCMKIDKK